MAETLALISPSAAFQASGESIVNSGAIYQKRLRESAERYQGIYMDYARSKVGEIIPRWRPPRNYRLPDKTVISFPAVELKRYDGNMSDFPVFDQPHPSIQERLQNALFSIFLLVLWNVVCFLGAHVIFVQRDIR